MTSKEKLDNLLGISDNKSIDEFLDDISINSEQLSAVSDSLNNSAKETLENIEVGLEKIKTENDLSEDILADITKSFSHINDLVNVSKQLIQHVYNNIVTTDLVDPELVSSVAALIETCHSNAKEWLEIYRDRLKFFDKIKFEMLQQDHKKELLELKYKLANENSKNAEKVPENMRVFNSTDIINVLNDSDLDLN